MEQSAQTQRPLACVTGASSGIGAEFARRLAAQGYDLLLAARRASRLVNQAEELCRLYRVDVETFPVDLSQVEDRLHLEKYLASQDRLEVLVNNAGFGSKGFFLENSVDDEERMVQVHALAPMRLIYAALPGMVARGKGAIVNVCSIAAFHPMMGNVNYCATKGYLKIFSEALAMELDGSGVIVQALCPGLTRTEFHDAMDMDMSGFSWEAGWMTPAQVVDASLRKLKSGKSGVVVPGALNRLMVSIGGMFPTRFVVWFMKRSGAVTHR